MKTKKYWILAVALVISWVLLISVHLWAATDRTAEEKEMIQVAETWVRRAPLVGLEGVIVSVTIDVSEEHKKEIEDYGLTEEKLKTFTELQLRRNAIKVLPIQNWQKTPSLPMLCVEVWVHPIVLDTMSFAASYVRIELKEDAFLERNPKMPVNAVTWNNVRRGLVATDKLKNMRDVLEDSLDLFCNDYLAANPKERPAKKDSTDVRQENTAGKK